MIPKEQSGELKNGVEPSPCETSSVAGQCQAKIVCDWQKFWVYLSQSQVTFVKYCSTFNGVTGEK